MASVDICCPHCHQHMSLNGNSPGQAVVCPHCKSAFQTPPPPPSPLSDTAMEHNIRTLLENHRQFLESDTFQDSHQHSVEKLIRGFHSVAVAREAEEQTGSVLFEKLLHGFNVNRAKWARDQAAFADEFNLFEVLGVEYDELMHSNVLAWILDRRIEHGTHAQGNLGFRLFLEEFKNDLRDEMNPEVGDYFDYPYWVRREVSCSESRVDIEIAATQQFVIHIENKILSKEGVGQTRREAEGLEETRKELGIPKSHAHGFYLTIDGHPPEDNSFHPIGWSRIANVVERFAAASRPPEVKLFALHYAQTIRRFAVQPVSRKETPNGETTVHTARNICIGELEGREET